MRIFIFGWLCVIASSREAKAKGVKTGCRVAEEIQTRIKKEVGEWLACSVGISWTKFLAKFASDAAIKGGVQIISSVSSLTDFSGQLSLFENNLSKKELSRALDKINDKYGEYTIMRGLMWGTDGLAKDGVGFRKIEV